MFTYGIYLAGTKEDVLGGLDKKVEKEIARVEKLTSEYQILHGWDHSDPTKPVPLHTSAPISNEFTETIIRAFSDQAKEQLSDVGDEEECSVALQVTIHRPQRKL